MVFKYNLAQFITAGNAASELRIYESSAPEVCKHKDHDDKAAEDDFAV